MTTPWAVAFVALCLVVLLLAIVVAGTLGRVTTVLERVESALQRPGPGAMEGLSIGDAVPAFAANDPNGRRRTSQELSGSSYLALFVEPGCPPCESLMEHLLETGPPARPPLLVVSKQSNARWDGLEAAVVLHDGDGSVSAAFGSAVTPNLFLVDGWTRVVAREIPVSADAVERLALRAGEGGDGQLADIRSSLPDAG